MPVVRYTPATGRGSWILHTFGLQLILRFGTYAAEAARQAMDAAHAALEKEVQPVTDFMQAWGGDDQRRPGITVRDTAPSTRPLALVESGQRLTHHLRLVDESMPTRRARPAGVLGAEVWVKPWPPQQPTSPRRPTTPVIQAVSRS